VAKTITIYVDGACEPINPWGGSGSGFCRRE
jgi:ribonuclease HI